MATAAAFPAKDLKEESARGLGLPNGATRCARCEGLMVIEQGFDLMDSSGHVASLARRCVQCGEVIDPIILQNRRLQLASTFGPGQK